MTKFEEKYQMSQEFDLSEYEESMSSEDYYINLCAVMIQMLKGINGKILEVGAGTGLFTQELLKVFDRKQLVLVEPDKNCCEKLAPLGCEIKQIEGEHFHEGKYQAIVMCEAFHHIKYEHKETIIENFKLLLNDKQVLLIGDFFIPEFIDENSRQSSLKRAFEPWINTLDGSKRKVAQKALDLALQKDGEYHLSPKLFEKLVLKSFNIEKTVNISKMDVEVEGATLVYFLKKK